MTTLSDGPVSRIEVITSIQRRRRWPLCIRNVRWCSDHLELHARNREVVRILFVLDACDREIITWSAVGNAGISGEMVRDLMVAAAQHPAPARRSSGGFSWAESGMTV
jgi:transposase InsO family protein